MPHEARETDLSVAHDVNPINPHGSESMPLVNTGKGLPGEKRPDSPIDPPPAEPKYAETQSPGVNRPPKSPGDYCGPYWQFITTQGDEYRCSALLFRYTHLEKPRLDLETDNGAKTTVTDWEVLYEDIFGMTAWRINLTVQLSGSDQDTNVSWRVTWPHEDKEDCIENGRFAVANNGAQWRGGFFSCNGFDATVPVDLAKQLTYTNVWKHLGSVHLERPLHLLIWGGDQNYIDFIFDDVPFLKRWVSMEWNAKWKHEFSAKTEAEVSRYHFNTYMENWERPEVKLALANVPSLMSWDDHDIFDGAGSYPPLLHDSPVMSGLFLCAQRFRLLFQHHTTPDLARKHHLFGHRGHNFISQCGPRLSVLLTDGRTERNPETIQADESWKMIFDRLETEIPSTTEHLLAVFAVPLSFVRIKLAESIFELLKNAPNKIRQLPGVKGTNSIFGLPELYDDLLDEWTHKAHIDERNRAIQNFQNFAAKTQTRVTFLSGDVHCTALSRFRTTPVRGEKELTPIEDPKLMYQVVSSAIVNMPPPRNALRAYHYLGTKWHPFGDTEEEFMNFFERMPEGGRKLMHRKIMPNRNWCYFELVDPPKTVADNIIDVTGKAGTLGNGADFWRSHWPFTSKHPYPSSLGPTSDPSGKGSQEGKIHVHSGGWRCRHKKHHEDFGRGVQGDLKIRLWLESSEKGVYGRKFAAYEVVLPPVMSARK